MNAIPLSELLGKYLRLRQELSDACEAPRWHEGRLDRLSQDIAEVERDISRAQPVDEQTNDLLPGS